ncbi:hypothetical protein [Burkholderia vietnamiensis]|uniref:hypothetical protein n=1 Tax=Burkholderia vietnamiensis TaxID=60552 RepID=UPI001CB10160|nr:hypothetical protein [Burkholderia vietnamiensis]CAG9234965.1 conserved membrane hypothetical protein [Burkholderia vietnamiensis]
MIRVRPALLLAVGATGTAISMSVLAGWQRGGTLPERAVLIAIGVVLVVSAHLLPALVRGSPITIRIMGSVLWGGCMVTACFGHLTFFAFAQQHAGEARAATVMADGDRPAVSPPILAPVMEERAGIAHELALAKAQRCSRNCDWLDVRRITLATKLDALEAQANDIRRQDARRDRATARRDAVLADPVTARLAALSGLTSARVDLLSGLVFAAVLEGVACLVWTVALRPPSLPASEPGVTAVTPHAGTSVTADHAGKTVSCPAVTGSHAPYDAPATPLPGDALPDDDVSQLVRDIAAGRLRPTVMDIRRHLGCSQARASALRRQLADLTA